MPKKQSVSVINHIEEEEDNIFDTEYLSDQELMGEELVDENDDGWFDVGDAEIDMGAIENDEVEEVIEEVVDDDDSGDIFSGEREVGEEIKMQVPEIVNTIDWGTKLDTTCEDGVEINQFGRVFKYLHIKNPDAENSGYYSAHFMPTGGKKWLTNNACLSKHYIVANLEKYVDFITDEIKNSGYKILNSKIFESKSFKLGWRGNINVKIQPFNDSVYKKIFNCIVGTTDATFEECNNDFHMLISNSYDGKSALSAEYNINMIMKDSNGKTIPLWDYFTLHCKTDKIYHRGNFNELSQNLNGINKVYNECIDILTSYNNEESIKDTLEKITLKLKKEQRNKLTSYWENIPKSDKNLYMLLIFTSIVLNTDYSLETHSKINPIIRKICKKASSEYKSKKTV